MLASIRILAVRISPGVKARTSRKPEESHFSDESDVEVCHNLRSTSIRDGAAAYLVQVSTLVLFLLIFCIPRIRHDHDSAQCWYDSFGGLASTPDATGIDGIRDNGVYGGGASTDTIRDESARRGHDHGSTHEGTNPK